MRTGFKFPLTQKQLEYVRPQGNQHLSIIHIDIFNLFIPDVCALPHRLKQRILKQSQETISSLCFLG